MSVPLRHSVAGPDIGAIGSQAERYREMSALDRHNQLIRDYLTYYSHGKQLVLPARKVVTDHDILQKEYRYFCSVS